MRELAQTNLQLYNQLIADGWPDAELDRARRAYELVIELFAGQIRPSGKTFVAHSVGTASAVACTGGRPDLVHAGLLHAAYTHGEFGDGRRHATAAKRDAVRSAIGPAAEALVLGYSTLGYSDATFVDWRARAGTLTDAEHDLVVLRLANEVDERADFGTRYSDRAGLPMSSDRVFADMATLADEVHEPALAALIRRAADEQTDVTVPAVLRTTRTGTRRIAPRSHRRRAVVFLRQTSVALRIRFRRIVTRARSGGS